MDRITRRDLQRLIAHEGQPKTTIYMPTYRAGREVRQNAIRYKNLLKQAVAQLVDHGMTADEAEVYSANARELEANDHWWQHQADGLSVFFTRNDFSLFRLPVSFEEQCTVSSRFQLGPLVPLLQDDGRYYLLAVSQNKVRLLSGSKLAISEIDTEKLPRSLQSALNIDEYISSLQHHSAGAGRGDAGQTLFHGHGGSDPDVKKQDEILQFFRRIDAALKDYFHADRIPLVFAGVDYLFPLFREACHYQALVDKPVVGNPDQATAEELHAGAWPLVQPGFDGERKKAIERYATKARDGTTADILEILPAARKGQIDTLLWAAGAKMPGSIAPNGETVSLGSGGEGDSEDLINAAAVWTLAHGGRVFSVPADEMPRAEAAAAILRYPLAQSGQAASA